MRLFDAMRLAISGLRGNILRTFLTIIGLAIGVGAILTVLTLGDAGEGRVEAEIAKLGVNKVWISMTKPQNKLQAADALALYARTDAPACAGAYSVASVTMNGEAAYAQIAAFDDEMAMVHTPTLIQGRLFRAEEFMHGSTVCLIDETLAERFGEPVLGRYITLSNRRLRIVGVIKSMTMNAMSGWNGMVIIPLQTYMDTFNGEIAEITLLVQPGQSTSTVVQLAQELLPETEGYRAVTLENEINAAREIVRIFVMVLASVAFVCMVTGGIGVMNVLLISVRERRREIGLIKAIGGSEKQVCLIFLLEAVTYAVLGSALGLGMGLIMIRSIGQWIGLSTQLHLGTMMLVVLCAALLGLVVGVAPALQASRMQPVDALRSD